VDGLSCEAAFEEERSLWIPAILHRSEELSVLQGVPALDYPEDMKGELYGDGVDEFGPALSSGTVIVVYTSERHDRDP
jgi:hypothetical protein